MRVGGQSCTTSSCRWAAWGMSWWGYEPAGRVRPQPCRALPPGTPSAAPTRPPPSKLLHLQALQGVCGGALVKRALALADLWSAALLHCLPTHPYRTTRCTSSTPTAPLSTCPTSACRVRAQRARRAQRAGRGGRARQRAGQRGAAQGWQGGQERTSAHQGLAPAGASF